MASIKNQWQWITSNHTMGDDNHWKLPQWAGTPYKLPDWVQDESEWV